MLNKYEPKRKGEQEKKELVIKAEEYTDVLPFWVILTYYLPSLWLAFSLGFNLGLLGNSLVFLAVSYWIAPLLATHLLKSEIERYCQFNETDMRQQGQGEKEFTLFNKRFEIKWHVDGDSDAPVNEPTN